MMLGRSRLISLGRLCGRSFLQSMSASVEVLAPPTHDVADAEPPTFKKERINKAMKAYLEKALEYKELLDEHEAEFELGKRHLANMMGMTPDMLTQATIDDAIEYLLPSGLHDKKARPILRPPSDYLPKHKAAAFDSSGRPFHPFFYTLKPNFYQILYEAVQRTERLKEKEQEMVSNGSFPDPHSVPHHDRLKLDGSEWLSLAGLTKLTNERLKEEDREQFKAVFQALIAQPMSHEESEFILKYRKQLPDAAVETQILPVNQDKYGNLYVDAEGWKKTSIAKVRVWAVGNGRISVNGNDFLYFRFASDRSKIMFPLIVARKLKEVDLDVRVWYGGHSSRALAVRLAVSRALCSLVDKNAVERLRLAGLLTPDPRRRERKKPGQHGARAKYTWKKR